MDDKEIVSALRKALADKVGQKRYDLWFGTSTRLEFDGRSLRIGVPNQCFMDWVRSTFRRPLEEACVDVLAECPPFDFHIHSGTVPAGTVKPAANESDSPMTAAREETKVFDGVAAKVAARSVARASLFSLEVEEEVTTSDASGASASSLLAPRPSSLTGDAPALHSSRKFASLDNFVVGEGNRLAYTSAELIVRQPGHISPLLFFGPTSVGKTHLLEAIAGAMRRKHRTLTTLSLSAEQFTSHFLEALRGSGLPSFRRKYRGVGLFILDDLQFLVGKRATQIELLHTIDTLLKDNRQLVFASDRSPAELVELGPELTTRLASGMVCRLEPPDYATRLGIVRQFASRMKLHLPREVEEFVAAKFTNHAREISGVLCRLQATGESLRRPITLALAEEALVDLVRASGHIVRLGDIEKAVCDVFGLDPQSLQTGEKSNRVSHPRMLAMWLARKHTRAALSEIGRFFGRRTHSTVVSAQKRVERWMASGDQVQLAERAWPVEDAIRQVERRLAAG